MILNGKAKEDFGEQCKYDYNEFLKLDESLQCALIIEWFDSVGIYIEISVTYGFNWYINNFGGEDYKTRQEATIQAIIKANEIYNNL